MKQPISITEIDCRPSTEADLTLTSPAVALIESAVTEFDIATRSDAFLQAAIGEGRAAIGVHDGHLVGFGYFSVWENGRFVSHSGLVVAPEYRGLGLGRALKTIVFERSRQMYPNAVLMSLTNSPEVKAMNSQLGFEAASLEQLTQDPGFWEGCKQCRNYARIQSSGGRCCCDAMVAKPKNY